MHQDLKAVILSEVAAATESKDLHLPDSPWKQLPLAQCRLKIFAIHQDLNAVILSDSETDSPEIQSA